MEPISKFQMLFELSWQVASKWKEKFVYVIRSCAINCLVRTKGRVLLLLSFPVISDQHFDPLKVFLFTTKIITPSCTTVARRGNRVVHLCRHFFKGDSKKNTY